MFDQLTNLRFLDLSVGKLQSLLPGIFVQLTALEQILVLGNNLRSLSPELFDNNVNLIILSLQLNQLRSLPADLFEPLAEVQELCLSANPGSSVLVPLALADDRTVATGAAVTLDAGASGGPWGSNVSHAWTQSGGTTVTLTGADTAMPTFTAPASAGELVFTLTVTGAGSGCEPHTDIATVTVTVKETCSDSYNGALRLAGEMGRREDADEGRLEICYDDGDQDMSDGDGWGVLCDDYWTDVEADVACRQMGYAGSVGKGGKYRSSYFGAPDEGVTIWLDNLLCEGDETSLLDCPRRRGNQSPGAGNLLVGEHNCMPSETVGVRCTMTRLPRHVAGPEAATRPPTVTLQPVDQGVTGFVDYIEVLFEFDALVTVDTAGGTPTVSLRIGNDQSAPAHYAGGSEGDTLLFRYALPDPIGSPGPVRLVMNSLHTGGGAIRYKAGGTDVPLRRTDVPLRHGGAAAPPFVVEVPALELLDENTDGSFGAGDKVEVTLTFNEPVEVNTAGGTPGLELSFRDAGGGVTHSILDVPVATYARGSGSPELVFSYTIAEADGSPAEIAAVGNGLLLNGGSIQSVATGLDAVVRFPTGEIPTGSALQTSQQSEDSATRFSAHVESLPTGNDGTTPFTFELHFSEEPGDLSYRTVGGDLLEVSGAEVIGARRLDAPSNQGWEVHAKPTHGGDIAIVLPIRACGEANAVCAADGRPLSQSVAALVPGTPFTAYFAQAPDEHDGSSAFKLHFYLSLEPQGLSYVAVRDSLFEVTGESIGGARRLEPGKNRKWELTVAPDGFADVTMSVKETTACGTPPGGCAADGQMLAGDLRTIIAGPASLSVADAEVDEGADATLDFVVTLNKQRFATTTVDYATSDGSAKAGEDYTAASGTLTFGPLVTSRTVSVEVLDDGHDEGSETMTLTLSNPSENVGIADGEATGTIKNTDAMPQAWLARFGRTVADQVLDAVEDRMTAARVPGTELSIAGQRVGGAAASGVPEPPEAEARLAAMTDWLRGETGEGAARGPGSRAVTAREVLTGSSFALTDGTAESGFGALWGRAAISRFDGREGDLTLDGEVQSAMLGADWTLGRGTAGLVLSHARGEGGYRSPQGNGEVESTLTGIYPWGRHAVSERLSLWGVAGYGAGTLTLTPEGVAPIETDMDLAMAAIGGRSVLVKPPEDGGVELAATSDALVVRTTSDAVRGSAGSLAASEAEVTRVRLGLEGTWHGIETGGGAFVPSFEIGVRHDGGDAETGFGVDIGAGLAWTDPERGLEADLRARGLLTHEDGSFRELGFAGSLAWDPDPASDRGLSFNLTQTVGAEASGGMDALLRSEAMRVPGTADDHEELRRRRLEAKLGYGLAAFGGRYTITPEIGFGLSETEREYIHSWRLAEARGAGLVFGLDVEGVRRESVTGGGGPEHRLGFGLGWRLEGPRAKDAAFEVRFEGSRRGAANDNQEPDNRIGFRLTARW